MDEIEKNIDESWKDAVEKEKESVNKGEEQIPPEPDFNFFITTLGMQAAIFLGQIPNPNTNKKEENLNQAKFIIDTLGLLKEKTKGNLSNDESGLLENLLYELRMQYIAKTSKKNT
jgi:hypothetical protein